MSEDAWVEAPTLVEALEEIADLMPASTRVGEVARQALAAHPTREPDGWIWPEAANQVLRGCQCDAYIRPHRLAERGRVGDPHPDEVPVWIGRSPLTPAMTRW